MITHEEALEMIQASVSSLTRAGLIAHDVSVQEDTVLLGRGSPLDSIAFVTFVTELEERISREANRELFLVLQDIQDYEADNPYLTAGSMARYLCRLTVQSS